MSAEQKKAYTGRDSCRIVLRRAATAKVCLH